MEASGRPVLGEPLGSRDQKKQVKEKKVERRSLVETLNLPSLDDFANLKNNFSDGSFPVKPALGVLGGLVVLWGIFGFFTRPPEAVADRARLAVKALADDDLNGLKYYASDSTRDDLVRWYDAVHPQLEKQRKKWSSKEAVVQVVVVEEDASANRGEVEAFITPAEPTMETASVMPPAGTKAGAVPVREEGPLAFHLKWVWSGKHWWIDGAQSLAMAPTPRP